MKLPLRRRVVIATLIGTLAFAISLGVFASLGHAQDWSWAYIGAQLFRRGAQVYADPSLYPWKWPQYYPFPTLLLVLPFTWLDAPIAAAVFIGLSSGLLAFGLIRDSYARLGVFVSAPFWVALYFGQWSPLITAAALLPGLFPLLVCKPNIGFPVLLAYPSRRGIMWCGGFVLLSIAIMPAWPLEWLRNLGQHQNFVPLLTFPGIVLLLALLCWRAPEARLLVALAAMPQRFYDPLLLWVLPRTLPQSLLLSFLSWFALLPWLLRRFGITPIYEAWLPYTVTLLLYGPAFVFVVGPHWLRWRSRRGQSQYTAPSSQGEQQSASSN
jgi:hypothetical protein